VIDLEKGKEPIDDFTSKVAKKQKPSSLHSINSYLSYNKKRYSHTINQDSAKTCKPSNVRSKGPSKYSPPVSLLKHLSTPPNRPPSYYKFPVDFNGRSIQHEWFNLFTWLSYKEGGLVTCSVCSEYVHKLHLKKNLSARRADNFSTTGYSGNRKALEAFRKHDTSDAHKACIEALEHAHSMQQSIINRLNLQLAKDQTANRKQLLILVKAIIFLVRQNIPLQGDSLEKSNLYQLLQLCRSINGCRNSLNDSYTHSTFQNEFISILANEVTMIVVNRVKANRMFGLIADEATDVSNKTLLTLVYRTVDDCLNVNEYFSGMYVVANIKSQTLEDKIMVR